MSSKKNWIDNLSHQLFTLLCINQFQRCPSPPGNRGAFAHVVSLGVGHSQFYRGPEDGALAYPGATPEHLTHVFSKDGWLIGKALLKTGLSVRD